MRRAPARPRSGAALAVTLALAALVGAGCDDSDGGAAVSTTVPTTRPILTTTLVTTSTVPAQVYTVQAGDTFGAIAARFGVGLQDLLEWNGLSGDSVLQPGDPLLIPPPPAGGETTADSGGEALPPGTEEYVVQAGDTFGLIAERFGVTVEALVEANGISIDTVVHPGDTLLIPPPVSTSTTATGDGTGGPGTTTAG